MLIFEQKKNLFTYNVNLYHQVNIYFLISAILQFLIKSVGGLDFNKKNQGRSKRARYFLLRLLIRGENFVYGGLCLSNFKYLAYELNLLDRVYGDK